jgi:hypothetical protein
MDDPSPEKAIQFDIVHHDGWIRVRIENGFATFTVGAIWDDEIVVRAINKAVGLGAIQGTMFTGEVVHDRMARNHMKRAARGTTWLDGKVTRLDDGIDGPQFRIDWEKIPTITE